MYEAFYGLREKPFTILPDPDLIYWGSMHRMAFTMLEFGVTNNAGFTVITGAIGSGKTTLLRYLLKRLNANVTMGLISNSPRATPAVQWILMSVGRLPRAITPPVQAIAGSSCTVSTPAGGARS